MSETEELKKNAEESKARQVVASIAKYLDTLTAEIDRCRKRYRDASVIYLIAWLAWVIVGFFDESWNYGFVIIFMFALIYDQYRFTQLRRAHGEFAGAIKVLELLGYIRPLRDDDGETKKREYFSEFTEMVKGWFTAKKAAQEKVYAPA